MNLIHKPYLINATQAHQAKTIQYHDDGTALFTYNHQTLKIPPDHQYDLTPATIFGLNERLTSSATSPVINKSGKTLRDEFNIEWQKYSETITTANGPGFDYGVYAYYAERNDLVRYAPAYWHKVVSIASSSKLISDPHDNLTWKQIREIFENTTIAIAGCSVGSNIAHTAVLDMRPDNIKVADKSMYKMENINRVRLGYWDIVKSNAKRKSFIDLSLKNKAETVAQQLYAIDPFLSVFVYNEGIHDDNINRFLDGEKDEPAADLVVEEIDDPRIKILIREEARKRKVPVLMVSDFGSCIQFDLLRYDQDQSLPLSHGIDDTLLKKATEEIYNDPGNRKTFFKWIDAFIGTDYRQNELSRIIEKKSEIPTSTIIPQLGSTATGAGAIAAEAIARIRLGFDYPPRAIFNKHTLEVKKYTF